MMYVGKHPNIIELIGVCSMKGSTQKKKLWIVFLRNYTYEWLEVLN